METIRQILKEDFMEGAQLIAGKSGIDREIQYVDIIEVPDVEDWIKKGGFYLTTGFSFKDNPEKQEKLIEKLHEKGASGLCIKKGRYFNNIPEEIVDKGNEYDFPIIQLPKEIPYVEIITPLMSDILNKQANTLKKSEKIHNKLTTVLLKGGGIEKLVKTLYDIINRPVLIQNKNKEILVMESGEKEEEFLKNHSDFSAEEKTEEFSTIELSLEGENKQTSKYKRIITPIIVSKELFGYISIFDYENNSLDKLDIRAVEHSSTIIALEILKEREKIETEKRLKTDLIEDILNEEYKSYKTIISRAQYLGWDLNKEYIAMVMDIDNFEDYFFKAGDKSEQHFQNIKERIKKIASNHLKSLNKEKIMASKSDSIIIFYSCCKNSEDRIIQHAKKIKNKINNSLSHISVTIGIGSYYSDSRPLKKSYEEARKAVQIGREIDGGNEVYHIDKLGVYKILNKLKNDGDLLNYYLRILDPLIEYDRENNTELLKTLEALLENFNNKSKTAQDLYIHRNSLNYRIKRIEEISNVKLDEVSNCLEIYMAIKIHHLMNN